MNFLKLKQTADYSGYFTGYKNERRLKMKKIYIGLIGLVCLFLIFINLFITQNKVNANNDLKMKNSSLSEEEFKTITNTHNNKMSFITEEGKYFSVWIEVYIEENHKEPKHMIPIRENQKLEDNNFSFLTAILIQDDYFLLNQESSQEVPFVIFDGIKYDDGKEKMINTNMTLKQLEMETVPENLSIIADFTSGKSIKPKLNEPTPFFILRTDESKEIEPDSEGNVDFSEIEKDEYVSSVEFSDSDIEKQIKNNYLTVVMKFLISDEIYNLDEINSN